MAELIKSRLNRKDFLYGLGAMSLILAEGCSSIEPVKPVPTPKLPEDITPTAALASEAVKTGPKLFSGFNYASWWRGEYLSRSSDQSVKNMADTGCNWMALVTTAYQDGVTSVVIDRSTQKTMSDQECVHVVELAHSLGIKVMLKPHINLVKEDANNWRGEIGRGFNSQRWGEWFNSYKELITHYATLSERSGVDQFCIGTELSKTVTSDDQWRKIIENIRTIYSGPLTYAASYGREFLDVKFWDQLDFMGVDAFYPLTNKINPSVDELKDAWINRGHLRDLEQTVQKYKKQLIFTEIGYRSVNGANIRPWEYSQDAPVNLKEQANCYKAAYETFYPKEYFEGMFWWTWDANPNLGGSNDKNYTPYKKPAEEIFRNLS